MSSPNLLSVRQAGPTTEISVSAAHALSPGKAKSDGETLPHVPVKETRHVSLEYDPILRRKVLNTYEILREIGRGEHGRVKLARDLVHEELVAIKIVSRKSKHERPRLRRPLAPDTGVPDAEAKIRREIAIMKRCHHKYIVRLREVLDDRSMYKIYLVLEYMDRGEVQWKRPGPPGAAGPGRNPSGAPAPTIPCTHPPAGAPRSSDSDLLSSTYAPNLTFRQARCVFRDVVLGLEYLHMQGIVHRDIKPANLLVAHDYLVKILDFGVSFASSLSLSDDGVRVSEMDLAKTVGTPAFFAPELCHTDLAEDAPAQPPVTHKIDIWALGVTLYCLLFGRVPFNADSEFQLFDVIVNSPVAFPPSPSAFHSPLPVSEDEFFLAQDLLRHMLDKNSHTRYDILNIKAHPFVLLDLDEDVEKLKEFFFLNAAGAISTAFGSAASEPLQDDVDAAVVGVGARIRSSLVRALRADPDGLRTPDTDALRKLSARLERSLSGASSSEDLSRFNSLSNSSDHLGRVHSDISVILSESQRQLSPCPPRVSLDTISPRCLSTAAATTAASTVAATTPNMLLPLSLAPHTVPATPIMLTNPSAPRLSVSSRNSFLLHDLKASPVGSRKGSSAGIPEAPRVETKRNVVGDVYLKNQSAIDAFKDIQQLDQKRRKSSAYAILASTNSAKSSLSPRTLVYSPGTNPLSPRNLAPSPAFAAVSPSATAMDHNSLKITVGPISINKTRRASSVISLPMTESFASLDSFNDNYLSNKYEEFRRKKQGDQDASGGTNHTSNISEKFSKFNLGSLMSGPGLKPAGVDEHIAPKSAFSFGNFKSRSSSSSSSASSYSSSSGSESDEEAGNLTLKFSSKVVPRSTAPFLSLNSRAFSHDSNLKSLVHQLKPELYPVILTKNAVDVEDVPLSLMDNSSASSVSNFDSLDMTPTASALTSNLSSATITQELSKRPQVTKDSSPSKVSSQTPLLPKLPLLLTTSTSPKARGPQMPALPPKLPFKAPLKGSNLRQEVFASSPENPKFTETRSAHPETRNLTAFGTETCYKPAHNGYFNNHYQKDLGQLAYKDNQPEGFQDGALKLIAKRGRRPSYVRSNSISLGLLQHERSLKESS